MGSVQLSTPESESPHVNVTVTSSRYQPAAFAARSGAPEIEGGVLSMLSVAVSEVVLPALSSATPVTAWPWPCVATVCGAVQDAKPDSVLWSAQAKVTVTDVLFQPLPFGTGDCVCVIVGAGLSMRIVMVECASALSARSTLQYSSV